MAAARCTDRPVPLRAYYLRTDIVVRDYSVKLFSDECLRFRAIIIAQERCYVRNAIIRSVDGKFLAPRHFPNTNINRSTVRLENIV